MKILYIGIVDFSYHCLEVVLENSGNVCGVVTSRNKKNNSDYKDLSPLANKYKLPIFYCENINHPEAINWIVNIKPDVIFCWGWSQIIKKELLSIPPMGVIGVHPALLPQNRGRHPIIWALALGLKESGLSFFFMDESADSGPILSQQMINIEDTDSATSFYIKVKDSATLQIMRFLPQLVSGNYDKIPQTSEKANFWRKRSVKDGLIDWRMNENAISNLIRSLSHPYPGAQFNYKEQTITVWKSRKYNENIESNIEPGKIIKIIDNNPVVKCYDGAIIIEQYEPKIIFFEGEYLL